MTMQWFVAKLIALITISTVGPPIEPTSVKETACPDGAVWHGGEPPEAYEYSCELVRGDASLKHGWSVTFDDRTGRKIEECEYREGIKSGRCSRYDPDGQLRYRGFFRGGAPVDYHWFWDPVVAPSHKPHRQRAEIEALLDAVHVPAADAPVLGQHLLDNLEMVLDDIRNAKQLCSPTHCVSAAKIAGRHVTAIQFGPSTEKVAAGAAAYELAQARATKQKAAEAKAARARQAKQAKAVKTYEKRLRAWEYTHLVCNDGRRSPSCVCGGSYQGCCSWHGGVAGCPREPPESPPPPED